ncbi:MAG TPA: hypothetical protein VE690_12095 [Rhodopila sp.]|nr:hypothetical protein [Rhodopila sp.]
MRSLRGRLSVLWVLSLCTSIAVGLLLVQLSRMSGEAQIGRAAAVIAHACDLIHERFALCASNQTGRVPALTDLWLHAALVSPYGVEGGIWQVDDGSLAYAYPTYEGSGPKTDLPPAERDKIEAVNRQAARQEQPTD